MRTGWRQGVRWGALALACLVFGGVMTWASGWGVAIWDQRPGGAYENADKREIWTSFKEARSSGLLGSAMSTVLPLPRYTREQSKPGTRGKIVDGTEVWTFGWPRPCLSATVRTPSVPARAGDPGQSVYRTGVTWEVGGRSFVLPVRVEWAEFRWNVACWALALGVVLFGWPGARWAIRRRRGRCTHCGYDLYGTPAGALCPECGEPRRRLRAVAKDTPCPE